MDRIDEPAGEEVAPDSEGGDFETMPAPTDGVSSGATVPERSDVPTLD